MKMIIFVILLGILSTPLAQADFNQDKSDFLGSIRPTDQIRVRLTSFDAGGFQPLFNADEFHFEMEPVITWNNLGTQETLKPTKFKLSRNAKIQNSNISEFYLTGTNIIRIVEREGPSNERPVPANQRAFKIAIDLNDVRRGLGFDISNGFEPAYFDIKELLSAPGHTMKYTLKRDNAVAQIEVELIRK